VEVVAGTGPSDSPPVTGCGMFAVTGMAHVGEPSGAFGPGA
jgi:hypothetical protein